jgi:hypothetical protein
MMMKALDMLASDAHMDNSEFAMRISLSNIHGFSDGFYRLVDIRHHTSGYTF